MRVWAFALALVAFSLPIFNPDLFWHLSAARWMVAQRAIPQTDPLSFTAFGAPWIDFEWASQLLWYVIYAAAGFVGLWCFKCAALTACFWPVDGLLRDKGASSLARAGALALWLSAILAQSDLRADLLSACFFAVLLRRLEAARASFLFGFALFALWANVHAGFILGFGLYALAAFTMRGKVSLLPMDIAAEASGAALGSLLNPYGARLYRVFLAHLGGPALDHFVMEWKPPSIHNLFQWPLLLAMACVFVLFGACSRRASRFLCSCAALGLAATFLSARFGAYFAVAAAACVFSAFPRPRPAVVALGLATATALFVPIRARSRTFPYDDIYVARRAVDFIVRERAALGRLRLFNQYEWGGYLGWRMGPRAYVFGDGRYLFQSQLAEFQNALASPAAFARFAARERLDGFLIRNMDAKMLSTRLYPNGSTNVFDRPWHVFFFPRERWALVYWDDQALLFVDRTQVPSDWLSAHEYRWLRPGDQAARADALARGEIPSAALHEEIARHAVEVPPR